MMKKWVGFLFVTAVSVSVPAHAGILLEPYVGYEMGTLKQEGESNTDTTGMNFGARIGYDFLGLKAGVDYQVANLKGKQDATKGDIAVTDMGVFVGYEFPALLQVYASYFVNSDSKFKDSAFPEKFTGNGMRLGIGWSGLPFVYVNLEYVTRTYDEYDGASLTDKLTGSFTALSVSVPLL